MKISFVFCGLILISLFFDTQEYNSSWEINNYLHARFSGAKGIKELLFKETNLDKIIKGIF